MARNAIAGLLISLLLAGCAGNQPAPATADFAKVVPGKTTQAEARALLGRPDRDLWLRGQQRQAWGYSYTNREGKRIFWLEWSADGTLHSTSDDVDRWAYPNRG